MVNEYIPVNLAVEDALSEAVALKLFKSSGRPYATGACYSQGGSGYLKRTIEGFNRAARGTPFFVLADLDRTCCPPALIREWLAVPRHPNLLFRIAVREVEAWLLAHAEALAHFFRINRRLIPQDPETLDNPKRTLITLAARSRIRELREDIVPPPRSRREQGPNYNGRLLIYVDKLWNPRVAARTASSLARTIHALRVFKPLYGKSI